MRYPFPLKAAVLCALALLLAAMIGVGPASARSFTPLRPVEVNVLVSDLPEFGGFTDPFLANPWGLAVTTTGLALVADNGTGVATLYRLNGSPLDLIIDIPVRPGSMGPPGPTGVVLNNSNSFLIGEGGLTAPAFAIFATEQGVLAGWNPDVNLTEAIIGAVGSYTPEEIPQYTGLAQAKDSAGHSFLYAADSAHDRVDIYDGNWNRVGSFTDPTAHLPLTPFNVAAINGQIWVSFAPPEEDDLGVGQLDGGVGFVDIFTVNGDFVKRFASGGPLNFPWAMTPALEKFQGLPKTVLIGNFGDGRINVYSIKTGAFLSQLTDEFGETIELDGLWSLVFSRPYVSGIPTFADYRANLLFTAGIFGEQDGLLGNIRPVVKSPLPSVLRGNARQ